MNIKDVKLRKGMSKDEVNELIGEHGRLNDEIYLGNIYPHDWICNCGNIIKSKRWTTIRKFGLIKCNKCKYNQQEERYKYEVEKTGEYEYIKSFRKGDKLHNGKTVGDSPYIQIKHKYCESVYEVKATGFINENKRCGNCCGSYENSFAHYIEQELGEPLDKYWDFNKNTVNPYLISRYGLKEDKVWIKCQEKDYHNDNGGYKVMCNDFSIGNRCNYCRKRKVHPLDSFGYNHFDKAQSWHPDNNISPFRVAPNSGKKFKFICPNCDYEWSTRPADINNGKGCPQCSSSKGEKEITKWLRLNNIEFIQQKEFDGLTGLGGKNLSYDFYLSDYNLLIEYQGEFHDGSTTNQTQEEFKKQQEHDRRKREYAKDNNIDLLEIWYWDFDNIEEILKKELNI